MPNVSHIYFFRLVPLSPQAYEDVQGFLNASIPAAGVFCDLVKALDKKCENIDKVCGSLKHLTVGKSRSWFMREILKGLKFEIISNYTNEHNYIFPPIVCLQHLLLCV